MSAARLSVLLYGNLVGHVLRKGQRLRFVYESTWREDERALPLSLSMPLAASEHGHDVVDAFLQGLLPDNEYVLERWAKYFHVSPRNPFALLLHVGEECAGAVQFTTPERVAELAAPGPDRVDWLTIQDVAERLRLLRTDRASGRTERDTGQFSLAGAQAKTALLFEDGRWGVPSGPTPTTHILKPPMPDLHGHVENEHLCLALAREVGLPTAISRVETFEGERAIVIERFDRVHPALLATAAAAEAAAAAADVSSADSVLRAASAAARASAFSELAKRQKLLRIHQEDLCQALGVHPTRKYQNEGGPDAKAIVDVLRAYSDRSTEDIALFVDALVFNWLIAGTDAHAKNYSVLLSTGGRARLAPLYDLGSALPHSQLDQRRLKLAMKLGGTYRIRDIRLAHFQKLAKSLDLHPSAVIPRARELTELLLKNIPDVCERESSNGLSIHVVDSLRESLLAHVKRCRQELSSDTA